MVTKTTCDDHECNRCPNACCGHHAHGGADELCDGEIPKVSEVLRTYSHLEKEKAARPRLDRFVQDALYRLEYTNDD